LYSPRLLIVLNKVFVAHLKHFVHECIDFGVGKVAVSDQDVAGAYAGLEENWVILLFHTIKFLDDFQDLLEAVIH
jgi:hypothetical protein